MATNVTSIGPTSRRSALDAINGPQGPTSTGYHGSGVSPVLGSSVAQHQSPEAFRAGLYARARAAFENVRNGSTGGNYDAQTHLALEHLRLSHGGLDIRGTSVGSDPSGLIINTRSARRTSSQQQFFPITPEGESIFAALAEMRQSERQQAGGIRGIFADLALALQLHPESKLPADKRSHRLIPSAFLTKIESPEVVAFFGKKVCLNEPEMEVSMSARVQAGTSAHLQKAIASGQAMPELIRHFESSRAAFDAKSGTENSELISVRTWLPVTVVSHLCCIFSSRAESIFVIAGLKARIEKFAEVSQHNQYGQEQVLEFGILA